MKTIISAFKTNRFYLVFLLALWMVIISFFIRLFLFVTALSESDFSVYEVFGIFGIGLFYDVLNAAYFIVPFVLYLWIVPHRIYVMKWHNYWLYAGFFILIFILLFSASSEILFWDEFKTRFNFIAVDYLVYTTEVIGNIRESYPIGWIVVTLIIGSVFITYLIKDKIDGTLFSPSELKRRTWWLLGFSTPAVFNLLFVDASLHNFSENTYANELAGNGMYELFAAYRNNALDYDMFYPHLEQHTANLTLKQVLQTPEASYVPANDFYLSRRITHTGPETKLNVVLISVESLSAGYLHLFDSSRNITPFLDSIAAHSLMFTNLYATGTRTVRGLEAISLSVPPTPGQSIVRRPHNEHLFSLATVFNEKGYDSKYIYGGYGYFDNMNYFFENNSYEVVDRNALSSDEIAYENIWGVADESLFTLAIHEIDKSVTNGKPVFAHIMTTSNHRPFTYPEGRIDIPSHTGREGAVKYTDYAIGKFIKESSRKAWYPNTVFVITADHCASSAGKTDLPIKKYRIPMLVFVPGAQHIQGRQERLMSQIDIAPTLLGLLNFSYDSKFFGYDIYSLPEGKERAFISTYQKLGYLKKDTLVVLSPKSAPELYVVGTDMELLQKVAPLKSDPAITREAIAWYQTASYAFTHHLLN